jgi:hypothetical protein
MDTTVDSFLLRRAFANFAPKILTLSIEETANGTARLQIHTLLGKPSSELPKSHLGSQRHV